MLYISNYSRRLLVTLRICMDILFNAHINKNKRIKNNLSVLYLLSMSGLGLYDSSHFITMDSRVDPSSSPQKLRLESECVSDLTSYSTVSIKSRGS